MSYSEELKNIKDKRQKLLASGFSLAVILPTLIVSFYYLLIAAPQYVSHTKFNVVVGNTETSSLLSGTLGLSLGGNSGQSNMTEAYIVKEYLKSQDMVETLQEKIDLIKIFNHQDADFWASPPNAPNIEDFLNYYEKMVKVTLNENNGLVSLDVSAFSPEDAQRIAESIMTEAEDFVNKRSERIQNDSIRFAEKFLSEAEQGVLDANISLTEFRNQSQNFDPVVTAENVLRITSQFEAELAKTKAEISTLQSYLKPDNPRIQNLMARKSSLEAQIKSQNKRLAAEKGSTLADTAQQYEAHRLKTEFAIKRYSSALVGLEEARVKAAQQMKYLLRIFGPTHPEDSLKPEALREIFGTFFIALVLFIVTSLILSALKDHIRT